MRLISKSNCYIGYCIYCGREK